MKLTDLQLDPKKEADGITQTYPGTDIVLTARRAWSSRFREVYLRERIALTDRTTGEAPEDAHDRAVFAALCEHSFAGWKNVLGEFDGTTVTDSDAPLEYTPELGRAILDPRNPMGWDNLYTFWKGMAEGEDAFRKERLEADAKKPGDTSNGSSSTPPSRSST